jgi:phosphatidylglycerophosphatase A
MRALARFVATLGPAGSFPIAPATFGSAIVTLIGWFLPVPPLQVTFLLLAIGTAIAVWVCGEAEKDLGHDAKPIIADEVIGQTIALLFMPHTMTAFVSAFLVFRVLDVWKPFGAREAQNLPGGFGIVADDAIAGVVSLLALQIAWYAMRRAGFGV